MEPLRPPTTHQPASLSDAALEGHFARAKARRSRGPSAEFVTIPADRQPRVTASVRAAVERLIQGRVPAARRAGVEDLLAHIGREDFYERVALYDPERERSWKAMAQVQVDFANDEATYDPKTRAYSESMRLTLHAALIQHFVDPRADHGDSPYRAFIELHPTAFHENGGWIDNLQIPLTGALAIVRSTPQEMWLNAIGLAEGTFRVDPQTVIAAEVVRQARREALQGWAP